jgi:hypothetical protein
MAKIVIRMIPSRNDEKSSIDHAVAPHASRESDTQADDEGEAHAGDGDAQRRPETAPDLRDNLSIADHRPPQLPGQRRADPPPILHDDRPIEACGFARPIHRLQRDALAVARLGNAKCDVSWCHLHRDEREGGDSDRHPQRRQHMTGDDPGKVARRQHAQSVHLARSIQKLSSSASTGTLSKSTRSEIETL